MRDKNQMGQEIERLIESGVIWGASWGFVDASGERMKKETHYSGVQGCREPWSRRPIAEGMLYDLASVSKVVGTTTRILQLIDEGKLNFDTPVSEKLPEFRHPEVTVRQLLLHTSGLQGDFEGKGSLKDKEELLEKLWQLPLCTKAGEEVCYSDPGYILLGLIIQAVEGCSLDESMQKHIFEPLGMRDTGYHPAAPAERFLPEEEREGRGVVCGTPHDSKAYLLGESGSAGLFSTLSDLMIFAEAYLRQDERLFSQKMFQSLLDTLYRDRGLGWNKEYGEHILYHTGFTGTSILMDMDAREAMVLLTNRIHPTRSNTVFLEERIALNHLWLDAKSQDSTQKVTQKHK